MRYTHEVRAAERMARVPKMARGIPCCPKLFLFLSPNQRLRVMENMCIRTHSLYDCVEIVYELPLLSVSIVIETFLHQSKAMRSVDWIFIIGVPASR
jgi:hypothetical protein